MKKKIIRSGRMSNLYVKIGLFPLKIDEVFYTQNQEELAALLKSNYLLVLLDSHEYQNVFESGF